MKMIERTSCAITGARDLEPLHTLAAFPVFIGCTDKPRAQDAAADMAWSISRSSGVIQLRALLPLEVLYPESHSSGCVGAMWQKHHAAFANYIRKFSPASVFEIGGAHGILPMEYCAAGGCPWTILEPNPEPAPGTPAKFIQGFFDDDFKYSGEPDTVVHSHVFEHMYDPRGFMRRTSGLLKNGNRMIFSVPNLKIWLERMYTTCLNFEHTIFLTEPYIEYLLAEHGFRLESKEYFLEDHSIFYSAVRDDSTAPIPLPAGLYEDHRRLYLDYVHHHTKMVMELNDKARTYGRPVYLFGAHIFAQSLLAFGLDAGRITCVLDNARTKHGKRLYGSPLTVRPPSVLKDAHRPAVILKAGIYNREIKEDILANINRGVVFWE